jgi:hypothetical protein
MPDATEVVVTMPVRVLDRLRREARRAGLPLEWVVVAFLAPSDDDSAGARAA